jgi:hypothetical protein
MREAQAYGHAWRDMEAARQKYNYDLQKGEQRLQLIGQLCACAVALTAVGGGLWLVASANHPVTGGLVSGGTVLSIVFAFLRKNRK